MGEDPTFAVVLSVLVAVIGLLVGIIFRMWSTRMDKQDRLIEWQGQVMSTKEAQQLLRAELLHDIESLLRAFEMERDRGVKWRHDVWHPSRAETIAQLAKIDEKLRHFDRELERAKR